MSSVAFDTKNMEITNLKIWPRLTADEHYEQVKRLA